MAYSVCVIGVYQSSYVITVNIINLGTTCLFWSTSLFFFAELVADLREAILQIARHFDAVDPKKVGLDIPFKIEYLFCKKLHRTEILLEMTDSSNIKWLPLNSCFHGPLASHSSLTASLLNKV